MNDLVATLRAAAKHPHNAHGPNEWLEQAADRIAQLEAALREIASGQYSGRQLLSYPPQDPAVNRARAALEDKA